MVTTTLINPSIKYECYICKFTLSLFLCFYISSAAWKAPIGIPAPEFGIEETHYSYTNQKYDFHGSIKLYKDAGNGPYTHYIDNTHSNATDSNNPFGDETKPRKTIPLNLQPGSVVELHGGPYTDGTYNGNTAIGITGLGTNEKPIIVRGYSPTQKIVFKKQIVVRGRYIIVENILMNETISPLDGYIRIWSPSAFIGIRNNEAANYNGGTSVYATQPKSCNAGGNPDTCFNENIVFYNNNIHNNGYPATDETGIQNIAVQGNSKKVWIVDNTIVYGGEDGIHIIFQYNDNAHHEADGIYIGRNVIHHHAENAIDVKHSKNVIISQNVMFGFKTVHFPNGSGSDGSAIVLNDEGADIPENHYVIFNEIYDSDIGIRTEYNGYIYGNIFHHIDSTGIVLINGTLYIINNSFYTVNKGIYNIGGGATFYIYNNIISNVDSFHIRYNSGATREIEYNLFYQPNGDAILGHGGKYYYGIENFPNGSVLNCIENNPNFLCTDTSQNDFVELKSPSPAINKGTENGRVKELISDFNKDFGLNIPVDYLGIPRPYSSRWDIGAYECTTNVQIKYLNNGKTTSTYAIEVKQQYSDIFISYKLPKPSDAQILLYNLAGKQLVNLVFPKSSRENTVIWNGCSDNGNQPGNGCYIIKLLDNEQVISSHFTLCR